MTTPIASSRMVAIVASPADAEAVADLEVFLNANGFALATFQSRGSAGTVVVVSSEAFVDASWVESVYAAVETHSPVVAIAFATAGTVTVSDAPAPLVALNWIWAPDGLSENAGSRILEGLNEGGPSQHAYDSLRTEAAAWANADYATDYLPSTPRASKEAASRLTAAEADPTIEVEDFVEAYVAEASNHVANLRKTRNRNIVVRGIGAGIALVALVMLLVISADVRSRAASLKSMLDSMSTASRPDVSAAYASGLTLTDPILGTDSVIGTASRALSKPWPVGIYGTESGNNPYSAVWGSGSDSIVILDIGAVATRYRIADAKPVGRHEFGIRTEGLSSSPDGSVLAAWGSNRVTLLRQDLTVSHEFTADGVRQVAVDRDEVAALDDRGRIWHSSLSGSTDLEPMTFGGTQAAVVAPSTSGIRVVDQGPASTSLFSLDGKTIATLAVSDHELEVVGVSPDGAAMAVGQNNAVWYVAHGGVPVLVANGTNINLVEFIDKEHLLVGSADTRARVIDVKRAKPVATACDYFGRTLKVASAKDGTHVACVADAGVVEVWDIESQLPTASPENATASGTATGESAGAALAGISGAETEIALWLQTRGAEAIPYRAQSFESTGTFTALADSALESTVLAGTSTGDVVQVAALANNQTMLVGRWHVPTDASVVALAWDKDGAEAVVDSADGLRWRIQGCAGCATRARYVSLTLQRQFPCWPSHNIAILPEQARDLMEVKACPR